MAALLTMVQTENFSDVEIGLLYKLVASKARVKTCCKCGRLAVGIDCTYIFQDGDMSKPKQPVCPYCVNR